jgi:hypothetical protein
MKSFMISYKASFLLVMSRTSSVVMVVRPACRAKLSRSIVTFSVLVREKSSASVLGFEHTDLGPHHFRQGAYELIRSICVEAN